VSYYECPHGNLPSERCARCVADGRRQPGDHNQRRYTDPDRVDKQTKADDDLTKRAVRQADERARVAGIRQAAQWTRQHAGLYDPEESGDGEPD
jgi:hypothetical protein